MKKIPTLFKRDFEGTLGPPGKYVLRDVAPGCEWVDDGQGVATRKRDGTAVMIEDGAVFQRREVRPGKAEPEDFVEVDRDEKTGKRFGWVPAGHFDPAARWLWEAVEHLTVEELRAGGTFELVGPKVQGNPEGFDVHTLIRHGVEIEEVVPCDFDGLRLFFDTYPGEGIVWHHEDGRMAKIKGRDFEGQGG